MAKLLVATVYDAAVGAYMPPFIVRAKGEAIRAFSDAISDKSQAMSRHPSDYGVFIVGVWDDNSGILEPRQPERLLMGTEVAGLVGIEGMNS